MKKLLFFIIGMLLSPSVKAAQAASNTSRAVLLLKDVAKTSARSSVIQATYAAMRREQSADMDRYAAVVADQSQGYQTNIASFLSAYVGLDKIKLFVVHQSADLFGSEAHLDKQFPTVPTAAMKHAGDTGIIFVNKVLRTIAEQGLLQHDDATVAQARGSLLHEMGHFNEEHIAKLTFGLAMKQSKTVLTVEEFEQFMLECKEDASESAQSLALYEKFPTLRPALASSMLQKTCEFEADAYFRAHAPYSDVVSYVEKFSVVTEQAEDAFGSYPSCKRRTKRLLDAIA